MRILMVCTGNTCRSPIAEAMLRKLAGQRGRQLEVRSAGVYAAEGQPIAPHAAEVLRRRNVPLPGGSTALAGGEVDWADLILTMTSGHKRAILERYPEAIGKTFTLKEFSLLGDTAMDDLAEAERLYSEWQVQQTLGQTLSENDKARLLDLQRRLPDFDIADPYGGPLAMYEQCADEIQEVLERALGKLEND